MQPKDLFDSLRTRGVDFFAGVPDSLLANFCSYVDDRLDANAHVITANEGNAVALAAGYHLSTGRVAAVYLQNSGLGNTINPLVSLADPEVYKIPLLLVIGWRGEPGVKDEPQHIKQGRITLGQLRLLEIPHWVVDVDTPLQSTLDEVFAELRRTNACVALVVRKDAFSKYQSQRVRKALSQLGREDALRRLLELASPSDLIVSTTGKTSRELYELRVQRGEDPRDFLTVGGMGHTASIALGVALGNPARRVLCLDGDGSVLMHMGALPVIGSLRPGRFVHVLLNNAAHESVGGQPTVAGGVDFAALARAVGYIDYALATDLPSLNAAWSRLADKTGPVMLEVRICTGSRSNLGRPTSTAEENKLAFMGVARG
jgi:phosphonopyruvate decarboxylase